MEGRLNTPWQLVGWFHGRRSTDKARRPRHVLRSVVPVVLNALAVMSLARGLGRTLRRRMPLALGLVADRPRRARRRRHP